MHDYTIREALSVSLLSKYNNDIDSLVVEELGLEHGTARADIAVINGKLQGYEIKGEYDSLTRLPSQVKAYDKIFDRITLVTSPKHLDKALTLLPEYWGIIIVDSFKTGRIKFKIHRKCGRNPNIDCYSLAQLLWKNEAIEIIQKLGETGSVLRQNRNHLYEYIANKLDLPQLRKAVSYYLRTRQNWRAHQ